MANQLAYHTPRVTTHRNELAAADTALGQKQAEERAAREAQAAALAAVELARKEVEGGRDRLLAAPTEADRIAAAGALAALETALRRAEAALLAARIRLTESGVESARRSREAERARARLAEAEKAEAEAKKHAVVRQEWTDALARLGDFDATAGPLIASLTARLAAVQADGVPAELITLAGRRQELEALRREHASALLSAAATHLDPAGEPIRRVEEELVGHLRDADRALAEATEAADPLRAPQPKLTQQQKQAIDVRKTAGKRAADREIALLGAEIELEKRRFAYDQAQLAVDAGKAAEVPAQLRRDLDAAVTAQNAAVQAYRIDPVTNTADPVNGPQKMADALLAWQVTVPDTVWAFVNRLLEAISGLSAGMGTTAADWEAELVAADAAVTAEITRRDAAVRRADAFQEEIALLAGRRQASTESYAAAVLLAVQGVGAVPVEATLPDGFVAPPPPEEEEDEEEEDEEEDTDGDGIPDAEDDDADGDPSTPG